MNKNTAMNNSKTEKDSFKKGWKQSFRDYLLFPLLVSLILIPVTRYYTIISEQRSVANDLSIKTGIEGNYDTVDEVINEITVRYTDAIDECNKLNDKIKEKNALIEELQSKISSAQNASQVEYHTIAILKDGQKTEDGIKNGLAIIDGKNYYSEDSVNSLLESKVYLDKETKSLFYDTAGTSNPKETKVALEDTEVLYDGEHYRIYKSPSSEAITLGSTQYKTGFTLSPKYGHPGKALFDLGGNYSKICFDVGRVTGASAAKTNEISVYFGEEFVEKIEINANVVSKHVEIELNNASEMIIKASTSALDGTSFGFVNVILEY